MDSWFLVTITSRAWTVTPKFKGLFQEKQYITVAVVSMKILFSLLIILTLSNICQAGDTITLARVSLDEATRQILKDGNKRVLAATAEIIDGKEVYIIKVLTPDGRIQHYKIDAETGAEIS